MRQTAGQTKVRTTAQGPRRAAPANVHIDIPHLSVEGYTAAQHARFMRTLEATLRTLAAQPRDWSALAAQATPHVVRVAPLTPRPGSTPEAAARELARRLFSRLPARLPPAAGASPHATERHHA